LPRGLILWRAQLGYEEKRIVSNGHEVRVEEPYSVDRMIPDAKYVGEGRANCGGIPRLYLATEQSTAMSEVRPWIGSYISLAEVEVIRDLNIVDCSADEKQSSLEFGDAGTFEEPCGVRLESMVWGDIAEAFSRPVMLNERHIDYVPTQILTEAFRKHGFDGIVYQSLVHQGGLNYVLFDLTAVKLRNRRRCKTESVSFTFAPAGNVYLNS
jgi:hypothetical protein